MALPTASLCLLLPLLPLLASSLPIVDPGVFVLQGVVTCGAGDGYCMLGMDCTADIDFEDAPAGQHCDGLADAFTPSVQFACCRYNERGKASSEAPTTEQSSFTITDVEQFLQEEVPVMDYQQNNEVPDDVDPESLINIVGVITDMTGVLGLVTEPYRATIPSHTTAPPTTPTTTTSTTTTTTTTSTTTTLAPEDLVKEQSNSSHASISLADILSNLRITQASPSTTPETKTMVPNAIAKSADTQTDSKGDENNVQDVATQSQIIATVSSIELGSTEPTITQRPMPTSSELLLGSSTIQEVSTTVAPGSTISFDISLPPAQNNAISLGRIKNTFVIER